MKNLAKILNKYQNGGEIVGKKTQFPKIKAFSSLKVGQWGKTDYSNAKGDLSNNIHPLDIAYYRALKDGENTFVYNGVLYGGNKDINSSIYATDYHSTNKLPDDVKAKYTEVRRGNFTAKKGFSILSKENNRLYNFNNEGFLMGDSEILRGLDKGDTPNKVITNDEKPAKGSATTPAGKYVVNTDPTIINENDLFEYDGNVTNLTDIRKDFENNLALHRTFNPKYRNQFYNNNNLMDNLQSYGCINCNEEDYKNTIRPNIKTGDTLYITNEPKSRKYSTGGDILKGIGAGAYGIAEGLVDNITLGLTDKITDMGYEGLSNLGGNSKNFQKTSNIIRGSGNIVGQVGGAVLTGGATTTNAISGGLKGANEIVQNTNASDKAKQWVNTGTQIGGLAASFAGGLNTDVSNAPQSLQGIMNMSKNLQGGNIQQFGSLLQKYQMGGQMPKNILPQNPSDLQGVTENTMEFQGASHNQGGIPLNNGAELEKNETVIKPEAAGNQNPYAISPNLVLDKETAKLVGLLPKYVGMKLSDISRVIEDMKPVRPNEVMSERTNSMNKKFALHKLMKANEILAARHRQENPIPQEMSDLKQEEMPQMKLGGGMPDDFMDYYRNSREYSTNPLISEVWLQKSANNEWEQYQEDYLEWKTSMVKANANLSGGINIQKLSNRNIPDIDVRTDLSRRIIDKTVPNIPTPSIDNTKIPFNLEENYGKIGMGLKGASLLAGLGLVGKKPDLIPTQYNPYKNDVLNNMNHSIDNQVIKNEINSALATSLNSSPARSWNVQRAMNAQLTGNAMEAYSKAEFQKQELNNRYKSEKANMYNNLGQQDVAARNMSEVLNAQTQANWRNNMREAIGNIGNQGADALIQQKFVQDARKDGFALSSEKVNILKNKWANVFGKDSEKFINMLQKSFPSMSKEEIESLLPTELKF